MSMQILQNDEWLLQEVKNKNQKAFKILFDKFYPILFSRCVRLVKDAGKAEDIVQEVFIQFWENKADIRIEQSMEAYLWVITKNRALDYLRREKSVSNELPEVGQGESDALEYQDLKDSIDAIIDGLPEKCRQIFVLSRFEDMSYKEIAESLEISSKTVENQISKALRVLRSGIKGLFSVLF